MLYRETATDELLALLENMFHSQSWDKIKLHISEEVKAYWGY